MKDEVEGATASPTVVSNALLEKIHQLADARSQALDANMDAAVTLLVPHVLSMVREIQHTRRRIAEMREKLCILCAERSSIRRHADGYWVHVVISEAESNGWGEELIPCAAGELRDLEELES
jgi:hypothetical protein